MNWKALNDKKTPWTYRVIRWLVWLFSPKYRLDGAENLPEGPCVLVGNHSHMYGPVAGELYIPGRHAVWCAGEMLHREEVAAYAYRDFWSGKPRGTRWFYRILSHVIVPLSVLIFTSAHTIPVYHDARLITTFRRTLEELTRGARVVIFPECYTRHNNIIYAFQDRFIDIARQYQRKTGRALPFVPMYVAPGPKTIAFGPPVYYDSDAPAAEERRRVCEALMDSVTALAAAMPLHTVVPYPNDIPKRRYPKNHPVEVFSDETTAG